MSVTWVDNVTQLNAANMTALEQTSRKGTANGYAALDATGKVPAAQLPPAPAVQAGSSGLLASRPAASATPSLFYFASDQNVLYFSTGSAWLRIGLPAGATTQVYSNTVPTGWVAFDGTPLPSSTGIYADLFAALGNTTATPDTTARTLVGRGSHADVDTLGKSDGLAASSRTPRHNSTLTGAPSVGSLTLPAHAHTVTDNGHGHQVFDPGHGHQIRWNPGSGGPNGAFVDSALDVGPWREDGNGYIKPQATGITLGASGTAITINPSATPAINGAPGIGSLAAGPGGTRPTDSGAFIVFSVVLAKL